jgi:hypothetical protein
MKRIASREPVIVGRDKFLGGFESDLQLGTGYVNLDLASIEAPGKPVFHSCVSLCSAEMESSAWMPQERPGAQRLAP